MQNWFATIKQRHITALKITYLKKVTKWFSFIVRCQKEFEGKRLVVISVMLAFGAMLSKEHGITVLGINFVWDVYLHRHVLSEYEAFFD